MPVTEDCRVPQGQSVLRLSVVRRSVVYEVDQFERRARLRMRQLGLNTVTLGKLLGVSKERTSKILRQRWLGEEVFTRLTAALKFEFEDWGLPFPEKAAIKGSTLIDERMAARKAALTVKGKGRKSGKQHRDSGA